MLIETGLHEADLGALIQETPTRILVLVCDGVAGLPRPHSGLTELETADTPHLDALASRSDLGIAEVIAPGVTPDCMAGYLALLGYQPARIRLAGADAGLLNLPSFQKRFRLKAAVVTADPTLSNVARSADLTVLTAKPTLQELVQKLGRHWGKYEFVLAHFRETELAAERGDFDAKVRLIEEVDSHIPELLALAPDVFAITGDHSAPSILGAHSWHPVPFLLHSPWGLPMSASRFTERAAPAGSLGRFFLSQAMVLLLAHALKLRRFGA